MRLIMSHSSLRCDSIVCSWPVFVCGVGVHCVDVVVRSSLYSVNGIGSEKAYEEHKHPAKLMACTLRMAGASLNHTGEQVEALKTMANDFKSLQEKVLLAINS